MASERNDDIFYKDQDGNYDDEYITLFADQQTIFAGRTPVQIYGDFMQAFAQEFSSLLGNTVTEIQVGMGPAGELRYPSYQLAHWQFCGIGAFQCYDRYVRVLSRLDVSGSFSYLVQSTCHSLKCSSISMHPFWVLLVYLLGCLLLCGCLFGESLRPKRSNSFIAMPSQLSPRRRQRLAIRSGAQRGRTTPVTTTPIPPTQAFSVKIPLKTTTNPTTEGSSLVGTHRPSWITLTALWR